MDTIFYEPNRIQLIERINALNINNTANWGKMNAFQMLRHCTSWNQWILGQSDLICKQGWLGVIFGKMALKGLIKDDQPMKKGMPAGKFFTIKIKEGDKDAERRTWSRLIGDYAHFSNADFVHDFFGKMTKEEIGILVYKHNDHHLRQFGG